MTGTTIGTWILGPEIGRGSLGVVYRAASATDPSRVAAVKVLTTEYALRAEFLLRFPGEMLPLRQLAHPNIARVFDCGTQSGVAYYASEHIDGTDLATLLKSAKRDEPGLNWKAVVVGLAAQLARALRYGHHHTLLHRDLKPGNVMVTADGTVKVTDYGVTKLLARPPTALTPDPYGTVGFLAPEVFTGKPHTRRSDLYSLGCVLYAAATGRPPYSGQTVADFLRQHCYALPDRPSRVVPKIPADLDDLICGLLHKDPDRRPASAVTVLGMLDQIRGRAERKGEPVRWPTTPDPELPAVESVEARVAAGRSRPLMSRPAVVIPLFVLLLGVAATLYFWPRPTAEELFARARPLIESADPNDWQAALDEYLDPLSDRYPDQFADQIQAVREKVRDYRTLRRAVADGRQAVPQSEAERLYLRGLAFARSGDLTAARRVWAAVTTAFADQPADERWVRLAALGVVAVDAEPVADDTRRLAPAAAAAERLKQKPEAGAVIDALERAYRDDPAAVELVRQVREK